MRPENFGVPSADSGTESAARPSSLGMALHADEFTGVAALQIPIASSRARGLEPDLHLTYSSVDGASPYGYGFSLALASITRRTGYGVPRYDDRDVFELPGHNPLVPLDGAIRTEHIGQNTYTVVSYAPQWEQAFDVIERWTAEDGDIFWRTVDGENITSLYGRGPLSRISDPRDPHRVAAWLVDLTFDAQGNALLPEYVAENTDGVPDTVYEAGRSQTANRYPGRLRYGNAVPYAPPPFGVGPMPVTDWLFDLVFDYGQYDIAPANPDPARPVRSWSARQDPYSSYATGFEVRTHRLCRGLLTFHNFPELGPKPVLTHAVRLGYDEKPSVTTLARVESIGYAPDTSKDAPEPYRTAALPPLRLSYQPFDPARQRFEPVLDECDRPLAGVGSAPSAWVDMLAEGQPGVLYSDGESVRYRAPRSVGPGPVRLGPALELDSFPIPRVAGSATVRLLDFDGDGLLELLVAADGGSGIYRQRQDGGWASFAPMPQAPTELTADGSAMVDLSGTGYLDLVTLTPESVRVFPADRSGTEISFDAPVTVGNDAQASPLVPAGPGVLIAFADVLGTRTAQVVRIADGCVECWPSLGHGAFAAKVTLAGAPRLDGRFDRARLALVDLDGSGAADLVYVDRSRLRVWLNRSGNGFAEPIEIDLPTAVTSGSQVRFADVCATGVPSVLVTDVLGERTWSCAFAAGGRPHLLTEIDNGLGARTVVGYRSSTAYRREDEQAGIPWLTYLPFPVQVVASIEQLDEISATKLVTRYRYRHGHFDVVARRFRGFGMVERHDADHGDPAAPPLMVKTWYHLGAWTGPEALEDAYRAEFFQADPDAFRMPPSATVWSGDGPSSDPEAHRQAATALVGRWLRCERYGDDSSPGADAPYDVSELNYEVVVRQSPTPDRHGIFSVREREAFETDYERNAADPRMTHSAVLAYDAFDNATRRVIVDYPRRSRVADTVPEQRALRIRFDLEEYVNEAAHEPHFIGLPYQARSFEALGIRKPTGYFTHGGLADAVTNALAGRDGASARLYDWLRRYYLAADGTEAPLGSSGPQLLARRDLRAFAEKAWIRNVLAPAISSDELETVLSRDGHFIEEPGTGYWWRPGTVRTYAPLSGFFVPVRTVDAFGATLECTYDAHRIALVHVVESGAGLRGQRVRVDSYDYVKLVPTKITDINDNVSEVLLDPLARVVRTSRYGEENGVRVGFAPLAGRTWAEPDSLADLVDNAARLLGGSECLYFYSFGSPETRERHPAAVARIVAQHYPAHQGTDARQGARSGYEPCLTVEYADGFARVFERKTEAEPSSPGGPHRWITACFRFNAKGLASKEYQPYYSDTYRCAFAADPPPAANAFALGYDALGRLTRLDAPLGVHATVSRSAWQEVECDFSDTVRRSRYWAEHIVDGRPVGLDRFAGQALLKSGLAADTPTTLELDNRGRVVARTVRNNATATAASFTALGMTHASAVALLALLRTGGFLDFRDALTIAFQPERAGFNLHLPQEYAPYDAGIVRTLSNLRDEGTPLTSRFAYDVQGNQTFALDPRLAALATGESPDLAANFRRTFALDGSALVTVGADSGTRYVVPDFRGHPVLEIDAARTATRYTYDTLGRLSTVMVRETNTGRGAAPAWTAERWIYGDTADVETPAAASSAEAARSANLNGRIWRVFDESGLTEYSSYTLTGEATKESRRFLKDSASPDWTPANSTPTSSLLAATEYTSSRRFDALGRLSAQEIPGGERLETDYLVSGRVGATRLVTTEGRPLPCVESAEYAANNQPVEIRYGNGVVSRYGYDPFTAALTTIRTTRPGGQAVVLQDMAVYHDVVGNITHLADSAFGPLFGLPQGFDADSDFDYDALYRLVRSSGMERAGRGAEADREGGYAGLVVPWTRSGVDPAGFAPYRRLFAYDAADNLYAVVHESDSAPWFGQVVVSDGSNRAVEAKVFGVTPADPLVERVAPADRVNAYFDPNGNQTRMLGIEAVHWTYRHQIEDLTAGTERSRYSYDARQRRIREIAERDAVRSETFTIGALRVTRETSADGVVTEWRRVRVRFASLLVAEYLTGSHSGVDSVAGSSVRRDSGSGAGSGNRGGAGGGADTAGRLVLDLSDPSRSIALRLGDEGELIDYEAYVPYGGTAFAIAPDPSDLAGKVDRYSAQQRDRSTGLAYYGARHLAPWTGRWASPDPAGPVDGLNSYAFVAGNPVSAVDIGGTVRITISGGVVIDIPPEDIVAAYHVAATELEAQSAAHPIASTGTTKSGKEIYVVSERGQLIGLAYQLKGDPIGGTGGVKTYRLRFGNLESSMQPGQYEKEIHFTVTVGNGTYPSDKSPEYHRLLPTATPQAEASRMLKLMKAKELPSDASYNNTMIPVMTISETDRSRIGALLAMTELHNIKHGSRSFFEAFDNNNDPHFVGAKKNGGAKALKTIDREHRNVPVSNSQRITKKQRERLHGSVSTFVENLARNRGARLSKFLQAKNQAEAIKIFVDTLVHKAGYPATQVVRSRPRRAAAVAAAVGIKRIAATNRRGR
jgi:RHS repeat-associated protein